MNWLQTHLLHWIVGAIPIGTITFAVAQYIKKFNDTIDRANPATKRIVFVPAIAAAVTALGAALHVPIVCPPDVNCLTTLDTNTLNAVIQAALGVLVAFITHAGKDGGSAPPASSP